MKVNSGVDQGIFGGSSAAAGGESLQEAIDRAGSPMNLMWKVNPPVIAVPVVPPEYTSWQEEQAAWRTKAVLFNQCHHMASLYIDGPDSLQLLKKIAANDMSVFAVGQAKQMVSVTENGDIISDVILLRTGENSFVMTGVPSPMHWAMWHAKKSGFNVNLELEKDSGSRGINNPPKLFRYQIQGVKATEIIESILNGPAPKVKFFHSEVVEIANCPVRMFRHGMLGQPGFEILGDWKYHDQVMDVVLGIGEKLGLVKAGGLAYYTNGIEGGWIPTPTPGIYSDPKLEEYRRFVPYHSFEGMMPIRGSYYSDNIENYYISPYELGYGRIIKFNHDFIGRSALEQKQTNFKREKVTLVFDQEQLWNLHGSEPPYTNRHVRDRIEVGGKMVGIAMHENYFPFHKTILALALIEHEYAKPGTQVEVAFGDAQAGSDGRDLPRIKATVEASPYNSYAKSNYRS